jgi:hypothetical protein
VIKICPILVLTTSYSHDYRYASPNSIIYSQIIVSTDDPREQKTGASSSALTQYQLAFAYISADRRPRRKSVTLSVEVPLVKNISGTVFYFPIHCMNSRFFLDSSKTAASKITTERTEAEDSGSFSSYTYSFRSSLKFLGKTKRRKKKKSVASNAAAEGKYLLAVESTRLTQSLDVTEEAVSKNRDDKEPIKRKKVDKNKKSARVSSEDQLEAARASLSSMVHLRSTPAAQKGSVSKLVQKKTKTASVVVSHDDHLLSSESSDSVHLGKAVGGLIKLS